MKKVLAPAVLIFLFSLASAAIADDSSWLEIGGDYQFRFDSLKGTVHEYYNFQDVLPWQLGGMVTPQPPTVKSYDVKNDSLMTNRFGLNLKANAMEDVTVKARLLMYKVWGHQTSGPVNGAFFADRAFGPNDGTVGHIPQGNSLIVDYAYATWSNIGQMPLWFSVGRRPTTGGIPTNIRANIEKTGTAGVPGILVDYAFDGTTIGYAPDIAMLPGSFVKLCYGKGFDSGFVNSSASSLQDTEFFGVMAALYDTPSLRAQVQYQKGSHIFDAPSDGSTLTGPVRHNLGDIDWTGGVVMGKVSDLNLFFSAAQSRTHPNNQLYQVDAGSAGLIPVAGLLYDAGAAAGPAPRSISEDGMTSLPRGPRSAPNTTRVQSIGSAWCRLPTTSGRQSWGRAATSMSSISSRNFRTGRSPKKARHSSSWDIRPIRSTTPAATVG